MHPFLADPATLQYECFQTPILHWPLLVASNFFTIKFIVWEHLPYVSLTSHTWSAIISLSVTCNIAIWMVSESLIDGKKIFHDGIHSLRTALLYVALTSPTWSTRSSCNDTHCLSNFILYAVLTVLPYLLHQYFQQ